MPCYMPVVLSLQRHIQRVIGDCREGQVYPCQNHAAIFQITWRHAIADVAYVPKLRMSRSVSSVYLSEHLHGFSRCAACRSADILECHNIPTQAFCGVRHDLALVRSKGLVRMMP